MTHTEMLKSLIGCAERYRKAQKEYWAHPGGGASQKIRNKLKKEMVSLGRQLDNAVFNINQFLKP
jgi:hypothetical protein